MRDTTVEVMFRAILDSHVAMNDRLGHLEVTMNDRFGQFEDRLGRIEDRLGRIEESIAGVRLELATHEHPDNGA